jgi:hypothetical protein
MAATAAAGLTLGNSMELTNAAVGRAGDAGVDLAEDLGTGDFTPDVAGAGLAVVDLVLHLRLDLLHVVV